MIVTTLKLEARQEGAAILKADTAILSPRSGLLSRRNGLLKQVKCTMKDCHAEAANTPQKK
jgi:hypothetical protein